MRLLVWILLAACTVCALPAGASAPAWQGQAQAVANGSAPADNDAAEAASPARVSSADAANANPGHNHLEETEAFPHVALPGNPPSETAPRDIVHPHGRPSLLSHRHDRPPARP